MRFPLNSYAGILRAVRECPACVCLLSDNQLALLSDPLPADAWLMAAILAERMVRDWLYGLDGSASTTFQAVGLSEVYERFVSHYRVEHIHKSPVRPDDLGALFNLGLRKPHDVAALVLRINGFVGSRLAAFDQADGLIPLQVAFTDAAVALPFRVIFKQDGCALIRDRAGHDIPAWHSSLEIIGSLLHQPLDIELLCELGPLRDHIEGGSYALPLLLAYGRKQGMLPDFKPRAVLATGAIDHAGLQCVGGLVAKQDLARKMSAIFIAPNCAEGTGLEPGLGVEQIIICARQRLQDSGLARLDWKDALARQDVLLREVREGRLPLDTADRRLEQYERSVVGQPRSEIYAEEFSLKSLLLRSAIANHSGNPALGQNLIQEARLQAEQQGAVKIMADLIAHQVVSLTDLGAWVQAEVVGRDGLEWMRNIKASTQERLRAEMSISGALGGQVLLQKFVRYGGSATEGLQFLRRALEIARQLGLPHDIGRDIVQLVLYQMLVDPDTEAGVIDAAFSDLRDIPPADRKVSEGHLHRIRWLWAYRSWLNDRPHSDTFSSWTLPDSAAGGGWVLATTLKYRGALQSALGRLNAAAKDFEQSTSVLLLSDQPLLQFIGATAAYQAGISLRASMPSLALDYCRQALLVFQRCRDWSPAGVAGDCWANDVAKFINTGVTSNELLKKCIY